MPIDYSKVPEHYREPLERYVRYGIPTGDAMRCVLENDLFGAVSRLDLVGLRCLVDIARFVKFDLPAACRGSRENVREWLARDWSVERGRVDEG